jgi:hypothetical protein
MNPKWIAAFVLVLGGLMGCGFEEQQPIAKVPVAKAPAAAKDNGQPAPAAQIEKLDAKHLPNPVRVHERVISGGLPEGDEAFAELQSLGVKTIISVDGAKPDVARAKRFGMRYVHLPHGYDGVPDQCAKELAKAVRDLPGTVYIHCHHGMHRSPAATAVACVGAGFITHDDAAAVLKLAGTSAAYRGLFQSADEAQRLDKALLDAMNPELPPIARLPAMAEAMVQIEHIHDRLKAIEKAGWKTPADQPALVPDHEALLLREQFTELLRAKEVQARPEKFQQFTAEAEGACQALEDGLRTGMDGGAASKLLLAVSNNCKACHTSFRDTPLREKR